MTKRAGSQAAPMHIFEMPIRSNPAVIVITAERARGLGYGALLSDSGNPVMISSEGVQEVDPDDM